MLFEKRQLFKCTSVWWQLCCIRDSYPHSLIIFFISWFFSLPPTKACYWKHFEIESRWKGFLFMVNDIGSFNYKKFVSRDSVVVLVTLKFVLIRSLLMRLYFQFSLLSANFVSAFKSLTNNANSYETLAEEVGWVITKSIIMNFL